MKRAVELTPLSHDHHQALFVALKLKRDGDAAAVAGFLEFFDGEGERHFQIEESILLPAWIEGDEAADADLARRVLAEHLQLRTMVVRLREGRAKDSDARELGEALEGHVRFEERELFPLIEAGLEPAAISELGRRIAAAHD